MKTVKAALALIVVIAFFPVVVAVALFHGHEAL